MTPVACHPDVLDELDEDASIWKKFRKAVCDDIVILCPKGAEKCNKQLGKMQISPLPRGKGRHRKPADIDEGGFLWDAYCDNHKKPRNSSEDYFDFIAYAARHGASVVFAQTQFFGLDTYALGKVAEVEVISLQALVQLL